LWFHDLEARCRIAKNQNQRKFTGDIQPASSSGAASRPPRSPPTLAPGAERAGTLASQAPIEKPPVFW